MLTDTKLRAIKPRPAAYRIADSGGLCIEVRPTGAKVWRFRYRFAAKASTMSLAYARAEREKARALLKAGTNPAHAAKAERATQVEQAQNTFAAVAGELLAKRSREGLSEATGTGVRSAGADQHRARDQRARTPECTAAHAGDHHALARRHCANGRHRTL